MSKERYQLRVDKGCLTPADEFTQQRLREKGYKRGDVLSATLSKPRNPQFFRLAHVFGQMCADSLDAFEGMNAHNVLKRIQIEARVGCDEMQIILPELGPVVYFLPRSLSFDSMDELEFTALFRQMCTHISKRYWTELSPTQIEEMAQVMMREAA